MPAFLLANAVTLNLNKWIYFKLRINAFIKVGFGDNIDVIDNVETQSSKSLSQQQKIGQIISTGND